jgi:membrane protein YqaA with SNARE-associated domain
VEVLWLVGAVTGIFVHPSLMIQAGNFLHGIRGFMDGPGLFLVALLDSSVLSIPEANDFLVVGLSIGSAWSKVAMYIGLTAAGSIAGSLCLYTIGRFGGNSLVYKKFAPAKMERIRGLFQKYGLLTLMIPSMLPPPCPFKIFVLGAGVFGVRMPRFLAAVGLGRLIRYTIWGTLAFHYGDSVTRYMAAQLPRAGMITLGLLMVVLACWTVAIHFRRRLQLDS